MPDSKLGTNCNLGQNVVISPGVKLGNNVKIQNNVSVYTGVELEDEVFCGPSMVFTNVVNRAVMLFARTSTDPPGQTRRFHRGKRDRRVWSDPGKYSFIGAGAVVTRDVPDYALMVGVPAVQTAGCAIAETRLQHTAGKGSCVACRPRVPDCRWSVRRDS